MKAGIKKLGTRAEEELYKEFLLLHNMHTFIPMLKKIYLLNRLRKLWMLYQLLRRKEIELLKEGLMLIVRNKGYRSLKPNQLHQPPV